MRRALACLPLALLFIAIVPSNAQKTGPKEHAEIKVLVVREGERLELACDLRVEQRAEWQREGSSKLPDGLVVAKESAAGTGGLTARLQAKAARPEYAGVYSCARGPQAQRVRVEIEPLAPRAAADAPTTAEPVTTPVPEITPVVSPVEGSDSEPGAVQYYDIPRNMSFFCDIAKTTGQIYDWEKNNVSISKVPELKDRYKLEDSNAKLVIQRTSEDDAGNYACKLASEARHWVLKARPYTKLPSTDSSVVEGQKLKLVCKVFGKPAVPVEWFYNKDAAAYNEQTNRGVQLENSTRIKLEANEAGVPNGQLVIEAAVREDAGAYACLPVVEENLQRTPHANAVTVLRVKDMYAALWPFLGICAEVLVLCVIILVYEKRRTKPELDDSDTDNHDQKKS